MTPQCSQCLSDGKRCKAPAVNGSTFCRHHNPQRPSRPVQEESCDSEHLVLPRLEDKYAVLLALDEVIHALAEGRIKRSVAETLLSGLKLVSRLVNDLTEEGLLDSDGPWPSEHSAEAAASLEPQLSDWQPDGQVAAHIMSGSNKADGVFSASHPHSADSVIDPSTECLIRELVAQSQDLAVRHAQRV